MIFFGLRDCMVFFWPKRWGDFFLAERLRDFFDPKDCLIFLWPERLHDFFWPKKLRDFFLAREVV